MRFWFGCLVLWSGLAFAKPDPRSLTPPEDCAAHLIPPEERTHFVRYSASHTHSQVTRDNALDYWDAVRANVDAKRWWGLPMPLRRSLIVVGDMHPGNFSLVPVKRGTLKYTLYDIKDLGRGSALMDLNHLIMRTIAVAIRRKIKILHNDTALEITTMLLQNYLDGLERQRYNLTRDFSAHIPSYDKYLEKLAKKNSKYTNNGKFYLQDDKLHGLRVACDYLRRSNQELRADLESILINQLGPGRLLDAATRPKDRGGSKNNLRIWVYFQLENGVTVLKEFKEIGVPAPAAYEPQPTFDNVIKQASHFLDYEISDVSPVVAIGGRSFFLRDRKLEYISVPYRQDDRTEFDELMYMAMADARWLGTFHGRQLDESNSRVIYTAALKANSKRILRIFSDFNRIYLTGIGEVIDEGD